MTYGLLDTSVFVANESGRDLDRDRLPDELAVSVVTLAELEVGVLAAATTEARAARLGTFRVVSGLRLLPIDEQVALASARLRMHLHEAGRRANVNDLWIAATALAHRVGVYTQDTDFAALDGVGGLSVVLV
jgi:predicted nucleic acid-binding protein